MSRELAGLTWQPKQLGEALQALSRRAGVPSRTAESRLPEADWIKTSDQFGDRLDHVATVLGVDLETVEASYGDVESLLRSAGPALIWVEGTSGEAEVLLLLGARRNTLRVLAPDRNVARVGIEVVQRALLDHHEQEAALAGDPLLDELALPPRRRDRARKVWIAEALGKRPLVRAWLLRAPTATGFVQQLRREGVLDHLVIYLCGHTIMYAVFLIGWWVVAQGALTDQLDAGRMFAWLLLLASQIPLLMLTRWASGRFSLGASTLLKRRLLQGILRLEPEEVRGQGTGEFLSRVMESSAIETLALGGGLAATVAIVELVFASFVIGSGAGGLLQLALFWGCLGVTFQLAWRNHQQRRRWTELRLEVTQQLVERMVGQRTRLVQEHPEHWHDQEDRDLERYLEESVRTDRWEVLLFGAASRGWYIAGVAGLAVAFVAQEATLIATAVGLGGLILGARVIERFVDGVTQLSGALIAWEQMKQLFKAGTRSDAPPIHAALAGPEGLVEAASSSVPLIAAHEVTFRYRPFGKAVLSDCDLEIYRGDRLLLEGPSGGGKSTLVSVLTGLRRAQSGVLLLEGLDYHAIGGEAWRQRIVASPQFHENHVFSATLAFNLLLGKGWPPWDADVAEAEALCRELGLGDLLDRMPSGMEQIVGETGWQLSHGERSRVYIARALLQGADLLVLDESFGALDPHGLRQALECVRARAPALLVVAHP